jgi:hypothetical protein
LASAGTNGKMLHALLTSSLNPTWVHFVKSAVQLMHAASAQGTHSPLVASRPVTVPLTRPHCGRWEQIESLYKRGTS